MENTDLINKQDLKPHPQEKSNFLSDLFYCWTIPIFKTGLKKELSEEDLYQTLKTHESNPLANQLEEAWNVQLQKTSPSLWKVIHSVVHKWEIIVLIIMHSFQQFIIKISGPLALGKLMGYYSSNESEITSTETVIYAAIIIGANFIESVLNHTYTIRYQQLGMRFKVACSSLIYRKSLKLNHEALNKANLGHIVNLLSNDMQKLTLFWRSFNSVWSSPIQAIIVFYLLYFISGPTALIGIVFLVTLIPLQMFMSKLGAKYRLKIALKTDERIRYMSEIITGIQVIKLYTWEQPFIKLIDAVRRGEVKLIKIANYLQAISESFGGFINRTAVFFCVLVYVLTGNNPDAQYVFVVLSFYGILMTSLSMFLPLAVSDILKANVSVKRFEKFLTLHEAHNQTTPMRKTGVEISNVTARWSKDSQQNTLTDIDFEIGANQTVAIIGSVGGGKSSLLQLCLGELPATKGSVKVGGKISYANQEPWLFAGTVKQNILFGQAMVKDRYEEVIKVCALEEDIEQFPYGDNTIIGERGILLSGGQKSRINLARAVYREADIYLLDDPLSAVDSSVGKQIFNNCISNYLKNKCVVLVTHQIQYLTSVDKIYLVTDGTISASGTYQDLQASGADFAKLLKDDSELEEHNNQTLVQTAEKKVSQKQKEAKETRASGKVSKKVYSSYVKASGSYFVALIVLAIFILTEIFATGADYFISFWVNLEQKRMTQNTTSTDDFDDVFFTQTMCISLYSALIVSVIIFAIVRSITFTQSCMRVSVNLHDKMFSSIVSATMNFFHSNSSGRILNRFSKDIGNIDEVLPEVLFVTIELSVTIIGSVLVICIVSPFTIIPGIIIFIVMYYLRIVFLTSSRSIKRMEATNRSPILAHLTESVKGLTTIRAFGTTQILHKEFDNYQDLHSSVYYMNLGTNRAFAIWLDLICIIYVSFVTIMAVSTETYGGNIGFVITRGISITGIFQFAVRRWSELENQMTSVERIVEYVQADQEYDRKTKVPSILWPDTGKIEFKSIFMQYSNDKPYVLKNLKFLIQPKEKIGIVGRTGAGKSSLISVLFRLVHFEGNFFIDDVDTKEISLSSLRSKISIIPQEPILFSGSVRKNLDPFNQYHDEQIWKVLEKVRLKEFVTDLPSGLYSNLSEGGSNFSVGQKQLVCLARALLRNNKILILDEATANVDPQTDELLQKTIRTNFANCTVLTIAHRLHSVMDSDKVLVMDNGVIAEFDHPHVLLQSKGVFHELVAETGKNMSENLIETAQKNYNTYHQQEIKDKII